MNKKNSSAKKAKSGNTVSSEGFQRKVPEPNSFPIVGIGASAGGFEAFAEMLKHLPEDTGMAFVFVQHLDPTHDSLLSEVVSRSTKIPVVRVSDGMRVAPNRVYVIPANATMLLDDVEFRIRPRTLVRGQHLPVNLFFKSLAEERGNQSIAVILSGTASDGTEGARAVKAAGGICIAQTEASAKFPSMPRNAILSGSIDLVLPPREIAREIARIARHPFLADAAKAEPRLSIGTGNDLSELLSLLRVSSGVDFGLYKQSTLQRRIRRRMVVHHCQTIKEYVRYVRDHPAELDQLYGDMLIHVTGFFRDKAAYAALNQRVFPSLLQARKLEDTPIRIWVPGCSTGEEVYSIAISVLEFLWAKAQATGQLALTTKAVQIFGTDISESTLDRARVGVYSDATVADIAAERLSRFFVRLDGGYQINKSIREMCIFARQNVVKDPPFSNLDLITCRNLLIYLGPELQKRVIPTLHYALKQDGFLMLGGSESLGAFSDHFILIDKKNKIYQKKRGAARLITYFTGNEHTVRRSDAPRPMPATTNILSVEKEVERIMVSRFVPASVVVNDQMEIIQFRGHTGDYLEPAPGHPTFSLSRMAREGLLVDLRSALDQARKSNLTVRAERVQVKSDGHREVDLEVIPVCGQNLHERFYIVVFHESPKSAGRRPSRASRRPASSQSARAREHERLKHEGNQLREQLKALIEEHESTTEEFKSANEEVLSANEELQSTNEEFETAKEELQSSNEELTTLNEELQNRNLELGHANNDLLNLLGNVNIPVVMIGNDLRIRRFTPPAQKLLNLIPADVGRRLHEIRPNLDGDDIEASVRTTVETNTVQEREVHEKDGAWYLMRVRPYKTVENKIDGAVISFQDIDAFKRAVSETRKFADAVIQNAREALVILDANLCVTSVNRSFCNIFQTSPHQVEGVALADLDGGQWIPPDLRPVLQKLLRNETRLDELELRHEFPRIGARTMLFNARRIEPSRTNLVILLSIEDITDYRMHQENLQTHSALLELASDAILMRDLQGSIQLWNRGAERIYGWRKSEAISQNISELLKTKFPAPLAEINRQLTTSGYWEGELVHTRKDGQQIYVESRWSLHREGQSPTVLELNTDITERKRYQEQLQSLSAKLMQVQDEERRRIARDLHDSTGQKLVALKLQLEQKKSANSEEVKLVDDVLQDIRTLSQLLHPPLLEEAGLISAIRWLVEGFSTRAGIKVKLNATNGIDRLSSDIELALFRVIQEALNNIHRHSGANTAELRVAKRGGSLVLTIKDDGHGMPHPPGSAGATLGVGLLGMRERLSQLGGRLTIKSGEKGTTIEAEVPVRANSEQVPS